MATKATVFKATLQIADMDRHYYADHNVTMARHPSETDERMMTRLLAFALNASERLEFGQGLTDEDEADIWLKDLTGAIELWIDVGTPDERLVRKACGRAREVRIYAYGGRSAEIWLTQNAAAFERQKNLAITLLPPESTQALAMLAERTMNLQFLIQDGQISVSSADRSVVIELPS
jgi:uncharacterized protein YaeQ